MTYSDFIESIDRKTQPADSSPYLLALWHEASGNWQEAHRIVQDIDTERAAQIHAYLHRVEGDNWNADYWYRCAGLQRPGTSLSEEWEEIVQSLLAEVR